MLTIEQVSNKHSSDWLLSLEFQRKNKSHLHHTFPTFKSHSKDESIESRCLLAFYDSNQASHHNLLTLWIQVSNKSFTKISLSLVLKSL